MEYLYLTITVLFFIILEGFFSGSEFGVVSYNRVRLNFLVKEGSKTAGMLSYFLKRSQSFLGTTLIGTNLCTVINTVIITSFLSSRYGEEKAAALAVIIFTPMTLLFGEILPKMVFQSRKETLTLKATIPLNFFFKILSPVVRVITYFSEKILIALKIPMSGSKAFLKDDIKYLFINDDLSKKLDPAGMYILQRVFDFNKIEVSDIMVPLVKVGAVQKNETVGYAM
ncbi:DUF21 domain-containing protein, partial [bacterium]|nr:DUF21 domain-containing protein [bacterium]